MIVISIQCDKCKTIGISRASAFAHQLREELKKQKWKHVELGGKDYCPKCRPRKKKRVYVTSTIELVNAVRK